MKRLFLFAALATLLFADGGIRPRGSAADYPAHQGAAEVSIGAAVIPSSQVKKLFATDLNGYIVMEVAVYPEPEREVNVAAGDFLLQMGPDSEALRSVSPATIAGIVEKKNLPPPPPKPGDITVVPSATIGYESGGYDPVTGQRTHGVYTGVGVGVGVGGGGAPPVPGPTTADRDRATMQQELEDKALPAGKITTPVAGYLYFPKPARKVKNPAPELTYYGASRQLKLRLK